MLSDDVAAIGARVVAVVALVLVLALAGCASRSCEVGEVREGCPCAEGPGEVCRAPSACEGGRCPLLVCTVGQWSARNCIDCCGEGDAGPPPDASYPGCAYVVPALDLGSTGDPSPITIEGGAPLAGPVTVAAVTRTPDSVRLTVAAVGQTRTFVVPGAHDLPDVSIGDVATVVLDEDPSLFGFTSLRILDASGHPVTEYARARGTAAQSLGQGVSILAGRFASALEVPGTGIGLAIDCREPDRGFCGRSATAWALTYGGRGRARQGETLTLYGIGSPFAIAIDVMADDFERQPSIGACTEPIHGLLSLEAHRISTIVPDAGAVDAGP